MIERIPFKVQSSKFHRITPERNVTECVTKTGEKQIKYTLLKENLKVQMLQLSQGLSRQVTISIWAYQGVIWAVVTKGLHKKLHLSKVAQTTDKLIGQCYDGASNMRGHIAGGHIAGVQAKVGVIQPKAIYTHCYAHCTTLVLDEATSTNQYARNFF